MKNILEDVFEFFSPFDQILNDFRLLSEMTKQILRNKNIWNHSSNTTAASNYFASSLLKDSQWLGDKWEKTHVKMILTAKLKVII